VGSALQPALDGDEFSMPLLAYNNSDYPKFLSTNSCVAIGRQKIRASRTINMVVTVHSNRAHNVRGPRRTPEVFLRAGMIVAMDE